MGFFARVLFHCLFETATHFVVQAILELTGSPGWPRNLRFTGISHKTLLFLVQIHLFFKLLCDIPLHCRWRLWALCIIFVLMNALFISSVWLLEKVPVRNLLFILFARSFIHFCSSHAWLPISIQCAGQSRVRVSVTSRLGVEEIADGTPTPTNQIDTKNI